MKFIPNPIDSSIDHFQNFKLDDLEYDIFVAISHGQNRGILKKVNLMKEKKVINYLISIYHKTNLHNLA